MPVTRRAPLASGESQAVCPECGVSVPLVGDRWLQVHRQGSAEYVYPRGNAGARCPGSLLLAEHMTPRHSRRP
jgi:ribosomal protein S27AE